MSVTVKPTDDPSKYHVGAGRACTLPNRVNDRPVATARALPGVIVLVHGVNDLGVSYPAQEQGLCQGLNERLSRKDMEPAGYRLPPKERNDKLLDDPDAVYFRRDEKGYSPVIPFYWGYRELRSKVQTNTPHGQYLDRYGNRMDKSGAQGGGPFANATSNLPDMWSGGFKSYGGVFNMASDAPHPLRAGPDRRYMVLAAMRLAALVQAIRHHHKDETVTLIGHSQGCLLSLLAQAFLDEWNERPADCLILNHPPYSLHEPFLERSQTSALQQCTHARLATLQKLVRVVTDKPHAEPPLTALENGQRWGVGGPFWKAGDACRYESDKSADARHVFAERDNRGKVYLYFCPEDLTVGFDNVIGIGSFGVPDTISDPATVIKKFEEKTGTVPRTALRPEQLEVPALPTLGQRFFQRVFTLRERSGERFPVGGVPTAYCLLKPGEDYRDYVPPTNSTTLRDTPGTGETRCITGEPLAPPCVPDLAYGEIAPGTIAVDPIDAAVSITNRGIGFLVETIDDPTGKYADRPTYSQWSTDELSLSELRRVEESLNANKAVEDRCRVEMGCRLGPGKLRITRTETPNEARLRWQSTGTMENSYHSAIVANPEHSRHVHAFDVAIAQGESVSNPTYRELLTRLADWRVVTKKDQYKNSGNVVLLQNVQTMPFYADLPASVRTLTEANARYYTEGTLPPEVKTERPPANTVLDQALDGQPAIPRFANQREA